MGTPYGSTPAARIPVTTRICVTSLRLGSQSETYSIWTNGTWLDFVWVGAMIVETQEVRVKKTDSPVGVIRFANESFVFFLVTSRGWGVSGVRNSELAIRTTLIWAQKTQVTMVPGTRYQFWITEATGFLTHGGFFDRPWYNQAVTLCDTGIDGIFWLSPWLTLKLFGDDTVGQEFKMRFQRLF